MMRAALDLLEAVNVPVPIRPPAQRTAFDWAGRASSPTAAGAEVAPPETTGSATAAESAGLAALAPPHGLQGPGAIGTCHGGSGTCNGAMGT